MTREDRKALLDRIWAFYDIKVLATALQYDLFGRLAASPMSVAELGKACGLPERGVRTLVIALTAMGLTEHDGKQYHVTEKAQDFIEGTPHFLGSTVEWANSQFDALVRLPESIASDSIIWDGFSHYIENPDSTSSVDLQSAQPRSSSFTSILANSAALVANRVLDNVDLSGARNLMDVGGNVGVFAATLLSKHPQLRATIFDLPRVCLEAKDRLKALGLLDRAATFGGDFMRDPWPSGHDVITFVRMFNSRPKDELLLLLRKAFDALPSGGRAIFFEENVLNSDPNDVHHLAIWACVLFQMGSRGAVRRIDEWTSMFSDVGFVSVTASQGRPWGLVVGTRP
jgi:3-hydroxy-5-methyl-1-naphthoate 3-O-methyltransferase